MNQTLRDCWKRYKPDKGTTHSYMGVYERLFRPLVDSTKNLLEIGVGPDGNVGSVPGGASLRMWRDYFPNATIYGMDIDEKKMLKGPRITTFVGNQARLNDQIEIAKGLGIKFDIIIDDGSHKVKHQINSLSAWLPWLDRHGTYVIEDVVHPFDSYLSWFRDKPDYSVSSVHFPKPLGKDDHMVIVRKNRW